MKKEHPLAGGPTSPILPGGITGATGAVAGAYIADITDGEDRARHFGLMSACFGVGMVAGPVAGDCWAPSPLHAPFLAAAVLNGLNLLLGCFLMQESHKGERRSPTVRRVSLLMIPLPYWVH